MLRVGMKRTYLFLSDSMKRPYWIRQTHLFQKDQYICSNCDAACDRPYNVCPVCDVPVGNAKDEPSWVDEAEGMSALLDDDW